MLALGLLVGLAGREPLPLSRAGLAGAPTATLALGAPAAPAPVPKAAPDAAAPPSWRGTQPDGGWRADAQGHLVVERAVRRRFDYWLTGLGEWDVTALSQGLLAQARRELPPGAATEVAALWQRYLALQQHPWQQRLHPGEPVSWRVALEERQSVRRQQLGRAWAEAFYGDEERSLWARLLALEAGQPLPAEAGETGEAPRLPDAAQREAAVQAQWADWERRLAQARAEWARLGASAELSSPQREAAMAAWLGRQFNASELVRVHALLGLPG